MLEVFYKNMMYLCCFFVTACNSASYISINVKEPANIVFPDYVEHVIIFDGTDSTKKTENHIFEYENNKPEIIHLVTDTLSTVLCDYLLTNLAEQQFFDRVDFLNIPLNEKKAKSDSIIQQIDTDAVITLTNMNVKSKVSLKNITDYGLLRGVYEVISQAKFTITGLHTDWEKDIAVTDTIFWESVGLDANGALADLPYFDDALLESIYQVATIAMKKMIPHWETEYRRYYTSTSGNMKNATNFIKENDWKNAYQNWIEEHEATTNKTKKAKCAANIALFYEMQHDLENAETWATKSRNDFENTGEKRNKESISYLKDYILRLQMRQKESAWLDMQEGTVTK